MESTNLLIHFRAAGYNWAVDCYLHGEMDLDNLVIIEATCIEGILDEEGWLALLDKESLLSSFWQEVTERICVAPTIDEFGMYDPYEI